MNNGSSHSPYQWTALERRLFRRLSTPYKIQEYLNSIRYRNESVYCSPRRVIADRKAHCFDSALFAAAALRMNGHQPLIMDLRSAANDDDHVIGIFKQFGCYGAIGKSNYVGLAWREPIYRTPRELALSYFDMYFNLVGQRTLREYSRPLNLRSFDRHNWMFDSEILETIAQRLDQIHHSPVLTRQQVRALQRVDKRTLAAGCLGLDPRGTFRP